MNIDYIRKNFYVTEEKIPEQDFFDSINKQINSSSKTYMHCHYGLHRTGFSVAMYLKSKGVADDKIINQLLKNDWKDEKLQNTLNSFLQKYFDK